MSNTDLDIAKGWIDLADPRLGSQVVFANDDFFAAKERLIQRGEPVFITGKYDDHGKWMDGWESRRRRVPGHDHCIIRLGKPGLIHGFEIDTRFFTGNYPPGAAIDVCVSGDDIPPENAAWTELVPRLTLQGDARLAVPARSTGPVTHVRLNIFPDGGVARLRIYGQIAASFGKGEEIDLAAMVNGALPVATNNEHYGKVAFMLQPGKALNMGDGWETRRRREPGHDWAIIKLAASGTIDKFLVDTNHFKGNYPDRCSIQGAPENGDPAMAESWPLILPEQKLSADHEHVFAVAPHAPVRYLRLNIFPDGGVARLRAFGRVG
jgi:allantoicase